jgi:hypothetical protein
MWFGGSMKLKACKLGRAYDWWRTDSWYYKVMVSVVTYRYTNYMHESQCCP